MGREPLPQQVAEALAKIKHRRDCTVLLEGDACTCDREARIAAAVARFGEEIARVAFTLGWTNRFPGRSQGIPTPKDEAEITEQAFATGLAGLGEAPRP